MPIPGDLFGSRSSSNFGFGQSQSMPKSRALKATIGVSQDAPLSKSMLQKIVQTPIGGTVNGVMIDTKTKYRANFALNIMNKRG